MKPRKWMIDSTEKAIKENTCNKCGGIIVTSLSTSQMAMCYGKRCHCKKSQSKNLLKKVKRNDLNGSKKCSDRV